MLKPMLARGELQTIGATTNDEYRKYIEKDAALERRFQPVKVEEPSVEETVEILKGLRDRYEAHHRVIITDEAIQAAAELADRYISDRFLPDKAIDLVDEAGARLRIRRMTAPPELRELDEKIAEVRRNKEAAIDDQDFEKAASLRDEESKLAEERKAKEEAWKGGESDEIAEVGDRGDRRGPGHVDRYPGRAPDPDRDREAAQDGRRAAQARHRPGRGRQGSRPVDPSYALGSEGSEPSRWLVHLRRPDRRG